MFSAADGGSRAQGCVRPVDPSHDMGAIADLLEVAFAGELDHLGNNMIADLRNLAALGPLLMVVDRVAPFANGYVYEQDGRVIGNVTVTPEDATARRWFISNVAVHPSSRNRGVAHQLMEAALQFVRRRNGRQVLLQVRVDNEPAQRLYRQLGFARFDTLVELLRPDTFAAPPCPVAPMRRVGFGDWQALLELARAATPPAVQQVRPLEARSFRPTPGKRLQEWFDDLLGVRRVRRWGLEEGGTLVAVISMLVQEGSAPARLDLAVHPIARGRLEGLLVDWGLAMLDGRRSYSVAASISTSHPEALHALQERHFVALRTLDQLVLDL